MTTQHVLFITTTAMSIQMSSKDSFYPIFLPHKHCYTVLPELQDALRPKINKISTASETYDHICEFLKEQYSNPNNYDSYRSEIVTFINYCWALGIDVMDVDRSIMLDFINFCDSPPEHLISNSRYRALLVDKKSGEITLNDDWRPFCNPTPEKAYTRSEKSTQKQLSVLSSLYIFFADIGYCSINPAAIAMRRYKNKNVLTGMSVRSKKALSRMQLLTMFQMIDEKCSSVEDKDRLKWERSRMLMHILVLAFPRRSEISANVFYSPVMSDFYRIRQEDTFHYVFCIRKAKGGGQREVICSKALVDALIRYRKFLGLSDFPKPDETEPLFRRMKAPAHGREAGIVDACIGSGQVGEIVKEVYELTAQDLEMMEEYEEADAIRKLSVHSTRHTGISLALASGRKPELLMHCSGHKTLSSLMIYNSDRIEYRIGEIHLIDSMLDFGVKEVKGTQI